MITSPHGRRIRSLLRLPTILLGLSVLSNEALAQKRPVASSTRRQPVDLGYLPGGTRSTCQNLCIDGSVVVGSGNAGGGSSSHAWQWTAANGLLDISAGYGLLSSNGYAISGDGKTLVGSATTNIDTYAFLWTAASGMGFLTMAPGYQGRPILAFGASHDGSVVTGFGYFHGNAQRVFRWTAAAGGVVPFDQILPGATHASGGMVSDDGSTAIGYCFGGSLSPTATIWDPAGTPTSLGILAGSAWSVPQGVNADGSVVVGYCADSRGQNFRAFSWSAAGGMTELALLPGANWAQSWSVTADGSTITGQYEDGNGYHAFLWTAAGGMRDLSSHLRSHGIDTRNWEFSTAFVSGDGSTLTGWGTHFGVATSWYSPAY